MDLARLLEQKRQLWKKNSLPGDNQGQIFLYNLSLIIDSDLKIISNCTAPDESLSCTAIKTSSGRFETSGNKTIRKNPNVAVIDYIFIQIPSQAGYLLQLNSTKEKISLERATQAIPHIVDFHGDAQRKNLFVTYPPILEEINILDENTVRTSEGKTLSLTQCSEMLITLAFDALESSLKEWVHN